MRVVPGAGDDAGHCACHWSQGGSIRMTGASTGTIAKESLDAHIPTELLSRQQWIAWWSVVGEGHRVRLPNGRLTDVLKAQAKPHKLPIDARTGGLAATTRS